MRIMGLDVGERRIGVALSDELGLTAQPCCVVEVDRRDPTAAVERIVELCAEHEVELVVIGLPLSLSGGDLGSSSRRARSLGERICGHGRLEIVYRDERFSTREAERVLIGAGVRRADRKKSVDKMAAALILQGYLDGEADANRS
ncbi:MAG: Holliday junction resolvase RuvX [Polyangia bacterium]